MLVARNAEGELLKIPVPMHYLYVFVAGALIGMLTITGAASVGIGMGEVRDTSTRDWMRLAAAPTLWPVQGRVTGSFGERIDPFSGEGAFHRGVDISSDYGTRIIAPADGIVRFADFMNGYGRTVLIDHGNGVSTLYGHLSGFAVAPGQYIRRGDSVGYVG